MNVMHSVFVGPNSCKYAHYLFTHSDNEEEWCNCLCNILLKALLKLQDIDDMKTLAHVTLLVFHVLVSYEI